MGEPEPLNRLIDHAHKAKHVLHPEDLFLQPVNFPRQAVELAAVFVDQALHLTQQIPGLGDQVLKLLQLGEPRDVCHAQRRVGNRNSKAPHER